MESLAFWLHASVWFSFRGKRWPMLFDHRALLRCQELTGMDMLSTNLMDPPARLIRALLYVALLRAGAEVTIEQAGKAITGRTMPHIRGVILEAWSASMPDAVEAPKGKAAPAKPRAWMDVWADSTSKDGLGLTDEQWLGMTPRQVDALQRVHLEQMQREEWLVGTLAAEIVNTSHYRPKQLRTADSFMIHPLPEKQMPITTGDDIMAQMAKFRTAPLI